MYSGAIGAHRKRARLSLILQAIFHHMIGRYKEAVGRDQESGSQAGALPIAIAFLVLDENFKAL
jgi:hypothetical protein